MTSQAAEGARDGRFRSGRALLHSIVPFSLYIFSFVASASIIFTAPHDIIRPYLIIYNISSVAFSLAFFLYYSYYCSIRRSRIILGVMLILTVAGGFSPFGDTIINVMYPAFLIFSDYLATQGGSRRWVTIFRVIVIVSVAQFIMFPNEFVHNLTIRCGVLAISSAFFALMGKDEHRISVSSPVKYLIGNYLFYNGTLLLLTVIVQNSNSLRIWYTCSQAGFILVLKAFDFSMRRANVLHPRLRLTIYCVAATAPLPAVVIAPELVGLPLFYLGYIGLISTGRYIVVPTETPGV